MLTEKLISLKENFTGQKFQWIKTTRSELLGKVVKCRDVDVAADGRFIVKFDDGSSIDSVKLNSDLLMIHGDMQPLSKEEVYAIAGPAAKPQVKQETKPFSPEEKVTLPPTQATPSNFSAPTAQPKTNMFSMFNSEESQLSINVAVKIPDKKLLKLMYSNAEDKSKFLSELAEYLHGMINKKVVQDAIQSLLVPQPTKKEKVPVVNLTEINEPR